MFADSSVPGLTEKDSGVVGFLNSCIFDNVRGWQQLHHERI